MDLKAKDWVEIPFKTKSQLDDLGMHLLNWVNIYLLCCDNEMRKLVKYIAKDLIL